MSHGLRLVKFGNAPDHNHNKDVHDTSATVKCMSACQHLLAFQYQDSIKLYQTEITIM